MLLIILELVRKRKLREEYSWLWLTTGATMIVIALWGDLLEKIGSLIGIVTPTSIVFFFGLMFLLLISLQFSVKISRLTEQLKNLLQEIVLIKSRIDEISSD